MDADARDQQGRAPIFGAKGETLMQLMRHPRINPNQRDSCGCTLLRYAASKRNIVTLNYLLSVPVVHRGLSGECSESCTALHHVTFKDDGITPVTSSPDLRQRLLGDCYLSKKLEDQFWDDVTLLDSSPEPFEFEL